MLNQTSLAKLYTLDLNDEVSVLKAKQALDFCRYLLKATDDQN